MSPRANRWWFPFILLHLVSITLIITEGSPVLRRLTACGKEDIRPKCPSPSSLLAIHEAVFSNFEGNETCQLETSQYEASEYEFCTEEFKVAINRKCAGKNACTFNYQLDHVHKTCHTDGFVTIDYACVEESSIIKYCNYPVIAREGYISSPGYPAFFPELGNCTWSITGGTGQIVSLSLVDLYLRYPRIHYGREICDEALVIYDGTFGGSRIATVCGQSPLAIKTYETTTNLAIISFESDKFTPYRGFLIYYRVRGCPTLPSPEHGYMVYRNGSRALYMCCKGHLFNDSFDNTRYITCVDDFNWNSTVPNCMSFAELREHTNYSDVDWYWNITDLGSKTYWAETNMMADVIIPSALMASLIIGNAVVLIIIMKIKRNSKFSKDYYEDEPRPCSSTDPNHSEA